MPSSPHVTQLKKLLIITCSGGGGLIQAANAKEQEARSKDPDIEIIKIDILKDWMGRFFGKFCFEMWNGSQRKGNLALLRFVISSQYILDYFSWPYLFLRALNFLFKENVDHVIDTQPLGTSAILKALRIYNARRGKKIYLQKILVDFPTKAAIHFFRPIKRLTKKDRLYLQLTTIAPLLEKGQTREEFWQVNCRLSEREVHYDDVCVRQSFRKYQNKKRKSEEFSLFLRVKNDEELQLMKNAYLKGSLQGRIRGSEVHFSIPSTDRMITILLGSQPACDATFKYVKKFIQLGKEGLGENTHFHIFVFCSEHRPGEQSLFWKVADYVQRIEKHPKSCTIIPFSFQSDDCIAPLFFRSDLTCTRSGGQTAMELMCVNQGETWIHSETKKDPEQNEDLSLEQLLAGIPGWEAANVLYLQKVKNAKIVTPETFKPFAEQFFLTNSHTDLSMRVTESTV